MPEENREEIQKRSRTTIEEAGEQGIGEPEQGIELSVPSYADAGGVSDLGVDEPVVPIPLRGDPPTDTTGTTDTGEKTDGGGSH
ncbi:MAG TPA: hypothetical protein VGR08_09410 [Thermomicrobiales bacterium]|nr:hypothetical protein [Thermomicrobiales bacterium]